MFQVNRHQKLRINLDLLAYHRANKTKGFLII
jgi:hypothetical protein